MSTGTTGSPALGSRWANRNLWPPILIAWLVLLYEAALIACLVPFACLPASLVLRRMGYERAAPQCQNVLAAIVGLWLVVAVWHFLH
jgi:hypothetical protein